MADPPPDNTREYRVRVIKIPEVTVSYEGPRDDKFFTEKFDRNTGLLSITVDGAGYGAPYDWYIDGVDQPVSSTQNTLVIKTAGFSPGRHQVTVVAKKTADSKHYSNLVYFLVQE
jgi:hypothetical protein